MTEGVRGLLVWLAMQDGTVLGGLLVWLAMQDGTVLRGLLVVAVDADRQELEKRARPDQQVQ